MPWMKFAKVFNLPHRREKLNAASHWRRTVKLRKTGRVVEIDTPALTRALLQKVT